MQTRGFQPAEPFFYIVFSLRPGKVKPFFHAVVSGSPGAQQGGTKIKTQQKEALLLVFADYGVNSSLLFQQEEEFIPPVAGFARAGDHPVEIKVACGADYFPPELSCFPQEVPGKKELGPVPGLVKKGQGQRRPDFYRVVAGKIGQNHKIPPGAVVFANLSLGNLPPCQVPGGGLVPPAESDFLQ